ncbi:NUDIX domain-containing protein [Candidatus Parcubacteria bacterium]|nr:MAG: NUDIX domain-containing protein [Candidatus Parcubacteria bacterium]
MKRTGTEVPPPSPELIRPPNEVLGESLELLNHLERSLEEKGDYRHLKRLVTDYRMFPPDDIEGIAAVVVLAQPALGSLAAQGELTRGTHVLLVKQQKGRWGGGTWAVPMGKIDPKRDSLDIPDESVSRDPPAAGVIKRAMLRELREEIRMTPAQAQLTIAGMFLDMKTENVVHVGVENIVATTHENTAPIVAELPDAREHSDIVWFPIEKIPEIENMSDGVRFVLLTAVRKIKADNIARQERRRQREQEKK